MIKVQSTMLLEVIIYLVEHGADAFNVRDIKTNKSAYDFAL